MVVVDSARGPGTRSRYCTDAYRPLMQSESELLVLLRDLGQRLPTRAVLIPTGDAEVLFMSRNRGPLSEFFDFRLTEEEGLELLANKRSQYEHAAKLGVPVPRTYAVDGSGRLEKVAGLVAYPCVIKPVYSHLWFRHRESAGAGGWGKLALAKSRGELIAAYDGMARSGLELIVQEVVEGGDDQLYGLYAYLDEQSEPLALFVRKKLRQWPLGYGLGCLSVSVRQPEVVEYGLKLLKSVGFRGLANIEFKRDARDGEFKLIEVNVRGASQTALPINAGVDIPYIAYQDCLGEPVEPVSTYNEGVKWVDLGMDVMAALEHRRQGRLSIWSWLRSIWDCRSYAYFAWDDPVPFLRHASGLLSAALRHLGSSLLRLRRVLPFART